MKIDKRLDSLELLGNALAGTFKAFADQAVLTGGRKVYFIPAVTIPADVVQHRVIGTLQLQDSGSKPENFLSAFTDETYLHAISFMTNFGLEPESTHFPQLFGLDESKTLDLVAEFIGRHSNFSATDFLSELNRNLDAEKPHRGMSEVILKKAGFTRC